MFCCDAHSAPTISFCLSPTRPFVLNRITIAMNEKTCPYPLLVSSIFLLCSLPLSFFLWFLRGGRGAVTKLSKLFESAPRAWKRNKDSRIQMSRHHPVSAFRNGPNLHGTRDVIEINPSLEGKKAAASRHW